MPNIETIIRSINRELVPKFEELLREHLRNQPREWLIEQIIRLSLDAHSLEEMDRRSFREAQERRRAARLERVNHLELDESKLSAFLKKYKSFDRQYLEKQGYLIHPPDKGNELITPRHRSKKGETLLTLAKDMLYALLFGEANTHTRFERVQRELLTITVPRFKADALDFMKATTELGAQGTWQDPDQVSNDQRADNVVLEVEFGEIKSERIGNGIVQALSLINNLEINEQILYARMENIEQSTLIV